MHRNMYTLKSKLIHAFYWTHFEDNCSLISLINCIFLMKFLKRAQCTRKGSRRRKGEEGFTFYLDLDLK